MADSVSRDKRGDRIRERPSARLAINMERIVWDFDPGMITVPFMLDRVTIYFIRKSAISCGYKNAF
jgi:hypothetical protein